MSEKRSTQPGHGPAAQIALNSAASGRDAADEPPVPQPRAARVAKEAAICAEAERQFAQHGFEGASLDMIAQGLGLSRHNLLYYCTSKELLYARVLNNVLDEWLARMNGLVSGADPAAALQDYIRAKLRFSAERPAGSKVFAREVMAGMPRFRAAIMARVVPALDADVRTFEAWADAGLVARLDFRHLMFTIWSSTQAYADLAPQFACLLGKSALDADDFEQARILITRQVLAAVRPD